MHLGSKFIFYSILRLYTEGKQWVSLPKEWYHWRYQNGAHLQRGMVLDKKSLPTGHFWVSWVWVRPFHWRIPPETQNCLLDLGTLYNSETVHSKSFAETPFWSIFFSQCWLQMNTRIQNLYRTYTLACLYRTSGRVLHATSHIKEWHPCQYHARMWAYSDANSY